MTIQTQIHVVYDGGLAAHVQVIGKSDGSGNETNVVKIDVSELVPSPSSVKIEEIEYTVEGGVVTLLWDDLTPLEFAHLRGVGELEYCRSGGLQNGADPQSRSGDILLSTNDFDADGHYTILFKLRKKFA
jgi:hypothetical protein